MGDRNNPIKFGPEWLRNLPGREATSSATNQNVTTPPNTGPGGATSSNNSQQNNNITTANPYHSTSPPTATTSRVLLAKLRYGREEMLALYERNATPPPELKTFDLLYQARGKPPFALSNTFEEEMRENSRNIPATGMASGDRFGSSRGRASNSGASRGTVMADMRGKRGSSTRQQVPGRGQFYTNTHRGTGFNMEDDGNTSIRPWLSPNANNGQQPQLGRNNYTDPEWASKMQRIRRPNTNWRQPSREENDEWRSGETNRNRNLENRDNWGGVRDTGDKRRVYIWDLQHTEELPEWAVENNDAFSGTFDSMGAFHGYSNDDNSIQKPPESAYPLTKSHTHGSFTRPKSGDEGSEEWWASEKAKKLSPKRFDANNMKYKKILNTGGTDAGSTNSASSSKTPNTKTVTFKEPIQEVSEKRLSPQLIDRGDSHNAKSSHSDDREKKKFTESKTFDAMMSSDISIEGTGDERGNFQSVMLAPNNSLRQKHQKIVTSGTDESPAKKMRPIKYIESMASMNDKMAAADEKNLVDSMFGLSLDSTKSFYNLKTTETSMSRSDRDKIAKVITHSSNMKMVKNTMEKKERDALKPLSSDVPVPCPDLQQMGMQNPALNAPMPLPLDQASLNAFMLQPPPVIQQGVNNTGMMQSVLPSGLGASAMSGLGSNIMEQNMAGLPGFQGNSNMPGMSASNGNHSSLFFNQNNNGMNNPVDLPMPNQVGPNMYSMHSMPQPNPQAAFGASIYGNMMPQSQAAAMPQNNHKSWNEWYYEDPKKIIQGPFSSQDMYNWYLAGFFSPSLMVRRACETVMRPLSSYGPVVPFLQISSNVPTGPWDFKLFSLIASQNTHEIQTIDRRIYDILLGGMESLWTAQPGLSPDYNMWMQQAMNNNNNMRVNNLPMYFWGNQPSAVTSNSLLPEDIAKEMKTEDEILAQLRASQPPPFIEPPVAPILSKSQDTFTNVSATPNLEELEKLIQKETLVPSPTANKMNEVTEQQAPIEKFPIIDPIITEPVKPQILVKNPEGKTVKQVKPDVELKSVKNKETNIVKNKTKKPKDEKKEEQVELKAKEEESSKPEKQSVEPSSPTKEEKMDYSAFKKYLDKERKEWIKDGFTIVKGADKAAKDTKKKAEEARANEEAERKRKEEQRLATEDEKKKKQAEALRKQQQQQEQQQARQVTESVMKKAPWSAVTNQALQATTKDGLSLAEIQRLEREKKLEQMKEQQQMMQIIAQQQAAALAREQEMQAGVGWAKKGMNVTSTGQSLTDIQAETWKQAATIAQVTAQQVLDEPQIPPLASLQANVVAPWANTQNGGGFWDTQPNQPGKLEKQQEAPKPVEPTKTKKKVAIVTPKKENSPTVDFENWCSNVLSPWSSKIDVPTFVGFLKDIESPYEVKDYVRCYLGDSKESNDFSRQFLERRSKLLRVGMVTPSDDLCSPAMAVNPRPSSSDFQEVKGKGKKTKKNKMLKVDARILGFSVTASEDRINVGDIDTV
ncbi:hypothetical protein K1T71_000104 [Dendrolimus kikuchii]|uniref:Uncharacterized protein n=1 Tax=Dendrolimus kikuchii TaxID=765133 RepID=A0ACC1DIN0_9NEOP|nr:hypothetical protein K1T71_000104 [Dendrolimus kikuchii]